MKPVGVTIDGVDYRVASGNSWEEYTEPAFVRQAEIAGASRAAQTSRPDILTWRLDDWSGGEGYPNQQVADEDFSTAYNVSSGAVNVTTPGQLSLGFALSQSLDVGTLVANVAPFLVVSAGKPWVFYSTASNKIAFRDFASGSWAAATEITVAANTLRGAPIAYGNNIFVTGSAEISQVNAATKAVTQWVASAGIAPAAANSRLYYSVFSSSNMRIRHVDLQGTPPLAPTDAYVALGLTTGLASCAIGSKVHVLGQETGEPPRLFTVEADASGEIGYERAQFPAGFLISTVRYPCTVGLNNVVFVGGYFAGATGEPDTPALFYVSEDQYGVVAQIRSGTSDRINCLAATGMNELMIGTQQGKVYRYDMESGAISEAFSGIAAGLEVTSIVFSAGVYYVSAWNPSTFAAKVYSTIATGAGKYPASATLTSSRHTFGLPEEVKVLQTIEVLTEPLPAGCSVSLRSSLDGAAEITTDAAGATMTHSGTSATRTVFTLSNAATERKFRYMDVRILPTGDGTATPEVLAVTSKCLTTGVVPFWRMVLDLEDSTASGRLGQDIHTGRYRADKLRTLRSNAASNTDSVSKWFSFTPYFQESPQARTGVSTYVGQLHSLRILQDAQGNGKAELVIKQVS